MMLLRFALLSLLLCIVSADSLRVNDSNQAVAGEGRRVLTESNKKDCRCGCYDNADRPGKWMTPNIGELEKAMGGYFCMRNDRVKTLIDQGRAECAHDCRRFRKMLRK